MSNIEVKESKLHGRGVYATANHKKGSHVCNYSGYVTNISDVINSERVYELFSETKTGKTFIGFEKPISKDGVGQLINDAVKPNFDDIAEKLSFREKIVEILKISLRYMKTKIGSVIPDMNVELTSDVANVKMFATRDIVNGEELTFKYGLPFWIRICSDNSPMYRRIALRAFMNIYTIYSRNFKQEIPKKWDGSIVHGAKLSDKLDIDILRKLLSDDKYMDDVCNKFDEKVAMTSLINEDKKLELIKSQASVDKKS